MAENLGASFTIDVTQLKAGLRKANAMIRESESEFRAAAAGMDDWTKSEEGLEKKIKSLNDIVDLQQKKVDALQTEYDRLISEGLDPTSQKAINLRTQINKETEALEKSKTELDKQTDALSKMQSESSDTENKTESLTDKVKRQESELKTLKDKYIDVVSEQGKASDEAQALADEISDLSGDLKENKNKLKEASDAADDLDQSFEDTSSGGISTFSVALGNVIANVVTNAIDKLKDLATEAFNVGADFEKAMSNVQGLSGASGKDLEKLENTAREYGSTTQFSATEAADALGYMALAGWDANQSADALGGVLNLAAASGMDLAQASDMVTDYLSAFGLEAKDSSRFADLLAYAQANANTTAEGLGEAFKNCAANMNAAGQDVETTTSLLSMMANQGLKGSEAGTALTAVMRDMTAKMKDGKIAIGDTSVEVMDANGNYRDMTDILMDVEKATYGMGDAERATALQSTFTSDSIKGLNLMLNAGIGSAADFEEELRNSEGSAKEMADVMNDNLRGQLTALKSKFEDVQITLYKKFKPALEKGVKAVNKLIDAFKWILKNGTPIAAAIAGVATAVGTFMLIINRQAIITAFTTALNGVRTAFMLLNTTMLANPIGLIVAAIAGLVAAFVVLWNKSDAFREFWIGLWENIKEVAGNVWESIKGFFEAAWQFIQPIVEVIKSGIGTAITEVQEMFEAAWGAIKAVWNFVKPYFKEKWETIKAIFSTCVKFFKQIFTAAWEAIKLVWALVVPYFKMIWENIKVIFSAVASTFKAWFSAAWTSIKAVWDVVVAYFKMIWENIKTIFSVVESVFTGDFSGAWEGIKKIWGNVKEFFQTVWDSIKKVFSAVTEFFKSVFSNAWEAIKKVFSNVGEFFGDIWETIKTKFTSIGTKIGDAIGGAFKTAINAVIATVEKAINTVPKVINKAIKKINELPGVNISKLPTISLPRLAKGGVVRKATNAIIGEDGAEAVMPLEHNTGWIDMLAEKLAEKTGGGVVVNQTNNYSQAHSRYEIYKSQQATAKAVKLAMAR